MGVLVQDAAESITSMEVEEIESVRPVDRFANRPQGAALCSVR
jgi:hypothetical protein